MNHKDDLAVACRWVARDLIGKFGWHLLSEEEFTVRAVATLAEKPRMSPAQACLNVYSRTLYNACQDVRQQEQAYMELHYYLYRIAYSRRPDLAEDATQKALLLVYEQIDTCRSPDTFLRFAQWKLRQALTDIGRKGRKFSPDPLELEEWREDPSARTEMQRIETAVDMSDCIRTAWEEHPRAHDQLRAVVWKYMYGLSNQEIAAVLGKKPAQVYMLIFHGKKLLRQYMKQENDASHNESPP